MYRVIDHPFYLIWWIIADLLPGISNNCEIMAKLVCNASLLKDHDYRLKSKSFSHKICNNCDLGIREDVNHLVVQCLFFEEIKEEMLDARFRNPPKGGFKHVECLCGTLWILSLEKIWFFQLCMIASTLFWSNSMDTFNGPIVLRIHF